MTAPNGAIIDKTISPAQITNSALAGLYPDKSAESPSDVIFKQSLLSVITTNTVAVEGDQVAVRVPYMKEEPEISFVKEGAEIPEAEQEFSELVITTAKIATLQTLSWEAIRASAPEGALSPGMTTSRAYSLLLKNCMEGLMTKANYALLNNTDTTAGPAGILTTDGIQQAGELEPSNLDAISDALTMIESEYGYPSHILMDPLSWGKLRKTKTTAGAGQLLLGSATEQTPDTLFGVQVVVDPAMPKGNILALDNRAILSSYGDLNITASEHAAFDRDSVVTRMTWRFGAKVLHPKRLALVTIPELAGKGK